MKPPTKAIQKQIKEIVDCLAGDNPKYMSLTIQEAYNTIYMCHALLEEDFGEALQMYHTINWSPEAELNFKIVEFMSEIQDMFEEMIHEARQSGPRQG